MTIILYEFPPTRSDRVRWTLLELGLPFESVRGQHLFGSAELKAISPLGKLPGLVDDGRPLFESAAICTWLADSHPEKGLIAPSGNWERALHDQWVSFCLAEIEAHLWSTARNSFLYPEKDRLTDVLAQNEMEGRKSLKALDDHLAATSYLVGGRFTVADIVMGYVTNWARAIGWTDGLEHVSGYNARLLERPHCPLPKGGFG